MTPLEIGMLLHIYARADPLPLRSPVHHETLSQFMGDELITVRETCEEGRHPYDLTERGRCYVEALMNVPLPRQEWVVPGLVRWPRECTSGRNSE